MLIMLSQMLFGFLRIHGQKIMTTSKWRCIRYRPIYSYTCICGYRHVDVAGHLPSIIIQMKKNPRLNLTERYRNDWKPNVYNNKSPDPISSILSGMSLMSSHRHHTENYTTTTTTNTSKKSKTKIFFNLYRVDVFAETLSKLTFALCINISESSAANDNGGYSLVKNRVNLKEVIQSWMFLDLCFE